jgi:membrane-associated phospholipid phosphatase
MLMKFGLNISAIESRRLRRFLYCGAILFLIGYLLPSGAAAQRISPSNEPSASDSDQSPTRQTQPKLQPSPSDAPPIPKASPSPSPTPSLEREFFKNILRDERTIFTAPFHLSRGDARCLLPFGAATAALLITDQRTTNELIENGDNRSRLRISRDVSYLGSAYAAGGVAAAFYLIGRRTHNARARETGLLAAEALIDSEITIGAIKLVTERQRPTVENGHGEFLDGGGSFPSGHAANAWSAATIIASEYHDRPLIKYGVYGLATAISVSRYTGRSHFLSDVLIGSAVGYGIGRYVYKTHHDSHGDAGVQTTSSLRRRLLPLIAPEYDPRRHLYAANLTWKF